MDTCLAHSTMSRTDPATKHRRTTRVELRHMKKPLRQLDDKGKPLPAHTFGIWGDNQWLETFPADVAKDRLPAFTHHNPKVIKRYDRELNG